MLKKKYRWVIFALFFFAMQVWFVNITLKYPYYGIDVHKNENQEWEISRLDSSVPNNFEKIQIGDIVKSVDGQNPELYDTVIRNEQLEKLAQEGYLKSLPKQMGHKEVRYIHLLGDINLEAYENSVPAGSSSNDQTSLERIGQLEQEVAALKQKFQDLWDELH